jgi:hypothetical protein
MPFPVFASLLHKAPRPRRQEENLAGFLDDDDDYGREASLWSRQNMYLAQSAIFERPRRGGERPSPPLAALAQHIDL